jgi:hypothetical protein
MQAEYRFDYSLSRPNRFADRMVKETVTVVLEPDVAAVFTTAASVNEFLRSVIAALPRRARTELRSKPRRKAG